MNCANSRNDALTVECPTCQAVVVWSDASPDRPFCSERCKLIDLGKWAAEEHAIEGEPVFNADVYDDEGGAPY